MTDSNSDLSRRDWFRLKIPRTNRTLGDTSTKRSDDPELAPVELPPNHHGMDLDELPPLREAILSREQLEMLFGDISSLASEVRLFQRSRQAQARAAASSQNDLMLAKEAFVSGKVPRLQIRYRWQDSHWIDTLEAREDGTRLVRILHVDPSA